MQKQQMVPHQPVHPQIQVISLPVIIRYQNVFILLGFLKFRILKHFRRRLKPDNFSCCLFSAAVSRSSLSLLIQSFLLQHLQTKRILCKIMSSRGFYTHGHISPTRSFPQTGCNPSSPSPAPDPAGFPEPRKESEPPAHGLSAPRPSFHLPPRLRWWPSQTR